MTTSLAPTEQVLVSFDPVKHSKAAELFHAAHSGRYRIIICGGAVRGGKSYSVFGTLMTLHKRYPGSRSMVVRDSLQTLRDTTLPTVEKAIPRNFVQKFLGDPRFVWKFNNSSSFQFFSEQDSTDPERKRWNGLEMNFIWLEQVEELQETTFDKALERLGSYFIPKHVGEQPKPILFMTVNPTDTWVRRYYDMYQEGTLPPDICYIPMFTTDNGSLEQTYWDSLQMLKITNPAKYKRFVEGDWDVREKTGGEWYWAFDWLKHATNVPYNSTLPVHVSLDFNVIPYMTMLCAQVSQEAGRFKIRFFKEYCLKHPDNRTDRLCQALIRDYLRHHFPAGVYYYGDRQGNNRIEGRGDERRFDDLVKAIGPYLRNNSDRTNSRVVVNLAFRDFINDLLSGLLPVDIEIDEEQCPELCKDLANTKEAPTGGIKKEKAKDAHGSQYEKNGHALSAFTYLIGSLLYDMFVSWREGKMKQLPRS